MGEIYFGGPSDYNQQVYAVLANIKINQTGQEIHALIRKTDHDLTFAPYDACGADTHPENYADSAPKGVSDKAPPKMEDGEYEGARWYAGHDDDPATKTDEREAAVRGTGTGKGSDVTIKFSPGKYGKSGCHPEGTYGSNPDEVLFHEMIHALRMMQGKYNQIPTKDHLYNYKNEEEFLAIVATNVYMSSGGAGNDELRGGHDGHYALKPPLNSSAGFLSDPQALRLMNIYRLVWADAFLAIARVDAAFNPFRELFNG